MFFYYYMEMPIYPEQMIYQKYPWRAEIMEREMTPIVASNVSRGFNLSMLTWGIRGALIINRVLFDGCSYDAGDFSHHIIGSGSDAFPCN
jgi:hypothetical protein